MNESAEGASWVIASIVLSTFVFVWGVGIHFGGCVECVWNAEPLAGGGRRGCVFGTTLAYTHPCMCVRVRHTHIYACVSLSVIHRHWERHTHNHNGNTHTRHRRHKPTKTHTHTHTHTHTADTGHTVAAAEGNNRRARGRMHPRTPILVSLFQFPHPPLYRKLTRSVLDWEGGLLVCGGGGWVGSTTCEGNTDKAGAEKDDIRTPPRAHTLTHSRARARAHTHTNTASRKGRRGLAADSPKCSYPAFI